MPRSRRHREVVEDQPEDELNPYGQHHHIDSQASTLQYSDGDHDFHRAANPQQVGRRGRTSKRNTARRSLSHGRSRSPIRGHRHDSSPRRRRASRSRIRSESREDSSRRRSRHMSRRGRSRSRRRRSTSDSDSISTSSVNSDRHRHKAKKRKGHKKHRKHHRSASSSSSSSAELYGHRHLNLITGRQGDDSDNIDIVSQIPKRTLKKIWADKYVEMEKFLPDYSCKVQDDGYALQVDKHAEINVVKKQSKKKIHNMDQWISAYIRFVASYTHKRKFRKLAPKLMRYAEIIRDLSQRQPGLAWLTYDIQFRKLRATNHASWASVQYQLWLQAASAAPRAVSKDQPRNANSFRDRQSARPNQGQFFRNTCFDFNNGCCNRQKCKWPHVCGFCRGPHPAPECKSKPTNADSAIPKNNSKPATNA